MKLRWESFEHQVREIAAHVYGKACAPRRIAGSNIDGVIDLNASDLVLIEITTENTVDKIRTDLNKLVNARSALFQEKKFARCIIVLNRNPTQAMIEGGQANNIDVYDVHQLAALFIEYDRYRTARLLYPFGSSVDPETGAIDKTKYIPVPYIHRDSGRTYSYTEIGDSVLSGHNFVLVGEYGSGKSRCVSEVFEYISKEWGATFRFPIAINLRECWGLEDADELIERHFKKLGLDEMKASAVKAYNRKTAVLLLDGFDEIGIQAWSSDSNKIREVRAQALGGIQDAAKNSGNGILVTGREHYFSSTHEMLDSLGLSIKNTTILHVREEFTLEELLSYFTAKGIDVTLPEWLPRRPLICQTIAQLSDEIRDSMFGEDRNAVDFWHHFMSVVCQRDARINKSFNADTIYKVFVRLADIARIKPGNVGPINPRELQEAFESVVGSLPVENASVMLQRLPSLGRIDQESSDRQFIDTYILDGLRAVGISTYVDADDGKKRAIVSSKWHNYLQPLGQLIVGREMKSRVNGFVSLSRQAAESGNSILAADIVSSANHCGISVNFQGIEVKDASISELDFCESRVTGATIVSSVIEEVAISGNAVDGVRVSDCIIAKVSGASSSSGLPDWLAGNAIEDFDSVKTMRRIRDVGLSPAHEVLVVVLKKTFFQPGTGRKEEALLRGFEAGAHNKVAKKVIGSLVTFGVLGSFKGKEGTVYTPNRAMTSRMKRMLDELRSSGDEIWNHVGLF